MLFRSVNKSPPQPPTFDAAITYRQRFRFKASAALVAEVISTTDLLNLLCLATTATTAAPITTAVRLLKVSIWGPPAADLVPVTVSIEYRTNAATGLGNRPTVHSDISVGATRVASVSVPPAKNSAAAMWQMRQNNTSVGAAFELNGPVNSIVDFEVECVLQNNEVPPTAIVTAGATVGTLYVRPPGTNQFLVPVSYPELP